MAGGNESSALSQEEVKSLVKVVQELAREKPNHTWMRIPKDPELTQGWRDVTYRELADAVDGMARLVERTYGIGDRSTYVAAYLGINDLRYAAAQVGLIKAGYKTLLPSPRNSQEGQASLINKTKCRYLLHSEGVDTHVESIKAVVPGVQTLQIPSFDELIALGASSETPFPGVYGDDIHETVIILHTSGSTGLPKPIYHTNGSIATFRQYPDVPVPPGRHNLEGVAFKPGTLMFAMTPWFHMMGCCVLWTSLLCGQQVCYAPPEKPPTASLIIKVLDQTKPYLVLTPPSVLEEIVDTPGGLHALGHSEYIVYGGGPLADRAGNSINEVSRIVPLIGSTEAGLICSRIVEDKNDWKYFEWSTGCGIVMEPDGDGLYECTIKPADKRFQAIFYSFRDIAEWRTKDLFEEHPTKKGLWLYKGRKDDVLVLSNAEKFNPVGFEKLLEGHPLIKGAMVVGQGRFQTGLLIEPEWNAVGNIDPADLVDQLWPTIEKANLASPAHGRVWKSKIAITNRNKPFKRAPKGSIVRNQTVQLYAYEIDALYANEASDDELGQLSKDADISTIKAFLKQAFKLKGFAIPDDASDDIDIFNYGIDSLQVMALSSTLSHATGDAVSPRVIYNNPTINALAAYLSGGAATTNGHLSREEVMEAMVKKYTSDLSGRNVRDTISRPEQHTVILTGSTGSLGQHALQELIESPHVKHIYALNRSENAEERQKKSFEARGITPDFSKVTFLTTNFGKDLFGLSQEVYDNLLQTVDIFIHNAWAVDFNKSLATYEEVHVAGTRRCVDFSMSSKYNAQIIFISSIASVTNWFAVYPNHKAVPEVLPTSHSVSTPPGYGESKHVASMILAAAAEQANVPVTVIRAGQLAGSAVSTAEWNRHEWFPSLVLTSKALGIVPATLGNQDLVDWVPMDLAAKAVVDVAESRAKDSDQKEHRLRIAHLINPSPRSWSELVPAVRQSLERETGKEIRVVPFAEWLEMLKTSPLTPEEIEKKPGLKLLDFYESLQLEGGGLPPMETKVAAELSETVRGMKAVDAALMEKWLAEWQK